MTEKAPKTIRPLRVVTLRNLRCSLKLNVIGQPSMCDFGLCHAKNPKRGAKMSPNIQAALRHQKRFFFFFILSKPTIVFCAKVIYDRFRLPSNKCDTKNKPRK